MADYRREKAALDGSPIYRSQIVNDPGLRCPDHRGDYGTNCDHCERDRKAAREEIAKTKRS
jgi:hypothetical protein